MFLLLSLILSSIFIQFCTGDNQIDITLQNNNKLYPWLVKLKQMIPGDDDYECYGALIAHNIVIAQNTCVMRADLRTIKLFVKSYCEKNSNGEKVGDCLSSEVSSYIKQDSIEAFERKEDRMVILFLKDSLNGHFIKPIELATPNITNENDCFFATWPSMTHIPKTDFDLNKSANKARIRSHLSSDIFTGTNNFSKDVLNALIKADYYDFLQSSPISDNYMPGIEGTSLVCSLQQNPEEYALVGIAPGYVLTVKKQNDFVKTMYFINLMGQKNDILEKIKNHNSV